VTSTSRTAFGLDGVPLPSGEPGGPLAGRREAQGEVGGGAAAWDRRPADDRALRHVVTRHVLDAVREGRLAPGDRVHETSLARALDVSLSPVRESLFRLADQGWLEHRPRRGFYVRAFTPAETLEIFTFRALLEGFAARTVAERWAGAGGVPGAAGAAGAAGVPEEDRPLLAEMERQIEEGARAARAGDTLAVGGCNARFHDALVRAAGSELLQRSWALLAPAEWLLLPTWGSEPRALSEEETEDWIARHRRIVDLLLGGDPAAAERELSEHVRVAGEGNLRRRFPRPPETAAHP
jgi:GntR family transcriptional regulator, vanillate catabolism transcriptional regulator